MCISIGRLIGLGDLLSALTRRLELLAPHRMHRRSLFLFLCVGLRLAPETTSSRPWTALSAGV